MDRMSSVVGPPSSIVIAGGWIKDPMVAAVKRSTLGDFRVSDVDEAGAMGAAMFAAIAAGVMRRPTASESPRWS
jgi:sugar (pentulose or hexulose) kinase